MAAALWQWATTRGIDIAKVSPQACLVPLLACHWGLFFLLSFSQSRFSPSDQSPYTNSTYQMGARSVTSRYEFPLRAKLARIRKVLHTKLKLLQRLLAVRWAAHARTRA